MKDKENLQKKFGKHLKKIRTELGVSSAELSRRSFIEKPHITRLEKGETNPTLYTLQKIAEALEISMDDLFKGF
jgi:transcriptional regulator with XRE-family HTH domain